MKRYFSNGCKKAAALLFPMLCFSANAEKQPNILLIVTDDQGYGDMGRTGNPVVKTPNMDRLYDQSVRFTDFNVEPACAPTRSALMTGYGAFRNGVTHTLPPRFNVSLEHTFVSELLRQADYTTLHIGKWHLGHGDSRYMPPQRGFDHSVSIVGGMGKHFDPVVLRDNESIPSKGYREDLLFDEAIRFVKQERDHPFFCYLATFSPHEPLVAPEEYIEPYRELVDEKKATFFGMIANVDYNLGRLLDALDETGLAENTVVVMLNDNGSTYGVDVYNAGMRGTKCTSWNGGFRSFSFWRYPGQWKPRDIDNLTGAVDVMPTFCELAGAALPEKLKQELDGYSLVPLLENGTWSHDDRMLFVHTGRWAGGMAARCKYTEAAVRWKNYMLARREPADDPEGLSPPEKHASNNYLLMLQAGGDAVPYTTKGQYHWGLTDGWELYDVHADPGCEKNLTAEKPELTDRLEKAYDAWWERIFPEMMKNGGDAKLVY